MKLVNTTIIILFITLLSSCEFSEECNYTGNVELTLNWEDMWKGLEKPDSLEVFFYKNGVSPKKHIIFVDTLYSNISSGHTNLLTWNADKKLHFKGLETAEEAELYLPTIFKDNVRVVGESPMICNTRNDILVPIEKTIAVEIVPKPIVKQLAFRFNIIKKGSHVGKVESVTAHLSGIATAYSLFHNKAIRSKATIFFDTNKISETSFSKDFYVLGINPKTSTETAIPNYLSVSVKLEDGENKVVEIDLTDRFNAFTDNVLLCQIDIIISAITSQVIITDWQTGMYGHITIK